MQLKGHPSNSTQYVLNRPCIFHVRRISSITTLLVLLTYYLGEGLMFHVIHLNVIYLRLYSLPSETDQLYMSHTLPITIQIHTYRILSTLQCTLVLVRCG